MNGYARCSMALAVATAILAGGLNGQSVVMADGKPPASITLLADRIDQVIASNYRGPAVAIIHDSQPPRSRCALGPRAGRGRAGARLARRPLPA